MTHKDVLIWILLVILSSVTAGSTTIKVAKVDADYSSIQAAINAARPGDRIEIQAGTYLENVVLNKTLTLRGIDLPVVDALGNGSAIALKADGVALEGIKATNSSGYVFRGMPDRFGGAGILIFSDNNTLTNNIVSSNGGCGIIVHWASINNTLIDNNASNNSDKGVFLGGSFNNLTRNIVSNNSKEGVYLDEAMNNILEGNTVSNNAAGIILAMSDNNTLRHNQIFGNKENLADFGQNNSVEASNLVEGGNIIDIKD
jgi:parallel beta-helix repeat protein